MIADGDRTKAAVRREGDLLPAASPRDIQVRRLRRPHPSGARLQLQFELQFTQIQRRPRRYVHDGDLRWCTSVDVRVRRAADS